MGAETRAQLRWRARLDLASQSCGRRTHSSFALGSLGIPKDCIIRELGTGRACSAA